MSLADGQTKTLDVPADSNLGCDTFVVVLTNREPVHLSEHVAGRRPNQGTQMSRRRPWSDFMLFQQSDAHPGPSCDSCLSFRQLLVSTLDEYFPGSGPTVINALAHKPDSRLHHSL